MNKKVKKKQGGPRKGAGRKPFPATERKTPVTLYVLESKIAGLGGNDAFRRLCYAMIDNIPSQTLEK